MTYKDKGSCECLRHPVCILTCIHVFIRVCICYVGLQCTEDQFDSIHHSSKSRHITLQSSRYITLQSEITFSDFEGWRSLWRVIYLEEWCIQSNRSSPIRLHTSLFKITEGWHSKYNTACVFVWVCLWRPIRLATSCLKIRFPTDNDAFPISTKSSNSDSSVQIQIEMLSYGVLFEFVLNNVVLFELSCLMLSYFNCLVWCCLISIVLFDVVLLELSCWNLYWTMLSRLNCLVWCCLISICTEQFEIRDMADFGGVVFWKV